ncbi:MAG: twin-arginine translocation signal domain-containing protein [Rhodospirillales bacterium]|jgi:anaerobic selenocysteine-containing dehydrogenase
MSNKKSESSSRRDFIKTAGLGVGVAAVASGVLSAGGAVAAPVLKNEKTVGYRETEHVKQYYESAKY